MNIWNWFAVKEETEVDELKVALEQHHLTVVETTEKAKESRKKANGLLQVAESALEILDRTEKKAYKDGRR